MEDKTVKKVIDKFKQRSEAGIKKYNTTLDRNDLNIEDWITHAQEEAMDLALYLERIKTELKALKKQIKDQNPKFTVELGCEVSGNNYLQNWSRQTGSKFNFTIKSESMDHSEYHNFNMTELAKEIETFLNLMDK